MGRPNIVVFMADQLVAPGPGGGYPCETPALDALAAGGVRFTQALATTPVCSPSRGTFHTGLLPSFHRLYGNVHHTYVPQDLDPAIPTLASVLRAGGYRTGISGVWHLSTTVPPERYGFDAVAGERPMFAPDGASPESSISLAGDDFSGRALVSAVHGAGRGRHGIADETAAAVAFLEDCARRPGTPFFLFASTRIPHIPWKVTRPDLDRVRRDEVKLPASFSEDPAGARCPPLFEYNGADYAYWRGSADELREALCCYWALASRVDEHVGILTAALRRLGLEENTLVVFCSDHGEMSGAHNLVGKGFDFYDEVVRVPLLMRWPAGIDPGRSFDRPVSFEDIMPTFCGLAGCPVPAGCLGRSLAPLFRGATAGVPWRGEVLLEQYNHVFPGYAVGLRSSDWLYVLNPTRGEQLYDRRADPGECANLALRPETAGRLREWRQRVLSAMREAKHPLTRRLATAVGFMETYG